MYNQSSALDTDTPLTREERIVITPNPTTADADDDFGFTTTIQLLQMVKDIILLLIVIQMSKYEDNVNDILGIEKKNKITLSDFEQPPFY